MTARRPAGKRAASSVAHLHPSAVALLELPAAERIACIRAPRWIGYTRANDIANKLEDLLNYPPSHRMPNLLLVGDTNNGKSMLVQRFQSRHPARDNPEGDYVEAPVVLVEAPPVPDEARLYTSILDVLFVPYKPNDRIDTKQRQAEQMLAQVGARMLVIDEIHNLLAGTMTRQQAFLNVLKRLGNRLRMPLVAVGTIDAFRAIQTDPQLANRFTPQVLTRWDFDEEYLRLLVSFERMLALKKASNLVERELALQVLALSEGYIGEIAELLNQCAVHAVQSKDERISLATIKAVKWVPPSKRKKGGS